VHSSIALGNVVGSMAGYGAMAFCLFFDNLKNPQPIVLRAFEVELEGSLLELYLHGGEVH